MTTFFYRDLVLHFKQVNIVLRLVIKHLDYHGFETRAGPRRARLIAQAVMT
jgi:hypothetical protein